MEIDVKERGGKRWQDKEREVEENEKGRKWSRVMEQRERGRQMKKGGEGEVDEERAREREVVET